MAGGLRVWLLLALAGCGTSDPLAVAPDAAPDAAVTVAGDGPPPADVAVPASADAALEATPSVDAPSVDALSIDARSPDAPSIDTAVSGPGLPGARCLMSSDCLEPLVCALGTCHGACREDRDCPALQRCLSAGAGLACQSTGSNPLPDAGAPDVGMLWGLSRGQNAYRVTSFTLAQDGCGLSPGDVLGMTLPVSYDETTMIISVGKPWGTPPMPVLGAGKIAFNMAQLVRENDAAPGSACTFHEKVTGQFALFDHDKFTLDVVEEESMFSPACTSVPVAGQCVSAWRWTLELSR